MARSRWRRWSPPCAQATEAALAVDLARRGRHGDAAARLVLARATRPSTPGCSAHDRPVRRPAVRRRRRCRRHPRHVGPGLQLARSQPRRRWRAASWAMAAAACRRAWQCYAVAAVLALVAPVAIRHAGPRRGSPGSSPSRFIIAGVFVARGVAGYTPTLARPFSRRTVCHAQQAVLFAILPADGHRLSRRCWPGKWNVNDVCDGPLRVGVGGPVGSGKTALVERLCKRCASATTSPSSPTTSTPRRTPSS